MLHNQYQRAHINSCKIDNDIGVFQFYMHTHKHTYHITPHTIISYYIPHTRTHPCTCKHARAYVRSKSLKILSSYTLL